MFCHLVEAPCFDELRTKQQLGYIVWSFNHRMEDRLFLRFVIQSGTYGPFELSKRVEEWFKSSGDLFENLSEEAFENHRKSLYRPILIFVDMSVGLDIILGKLVWRLNI